MFDRQREEDHDIPHPPISTLMGRVRAFGEALVVADHEPSKLSDSVKANTNVKVWMSLGSGHDTAEMAETFGVEDDEVNVTRTLERGEAVVATADRSPVPVELPLPDLAADTPLDAVRERTEQVLDELSYGERVRPDLFEAAVRDVDTDDAEQAGDEAETTAVGEVAEQLLASVDDEPFLSMSERYDAIGVGSKQGNRAKQELLALELVREVEVDTGTPGRNPKLLELTDDGVTVLEERGYDVAATGRRGIEHRYWQRQVADHYDAEGFDVVIEHGVADGVIDVFCERPGEQVAVEVAMSPEHEVANVEKCLDAEVDRVEVVAVDADVLARVEDRMREAFGEVPERVAFVDASEYA